MTLAVLWYREKFQELWCAADSRIASGGSIATDSGPKILHIPIKCFETSAPMQFTQTHNYGFGFAFAGSTLAAISTHALATACTQNLLSNEPNARPVRLQVVAELFRKVGEHFIKDISSRLTGAINPTQYFFDCFIFGYCPVARSYQGFAIVPNTTGPDFRMVLGNLMLRSGGFHLIGSGEQKFLEIMEEITRTHENPGVVVALREMLRRETQADVGGHFQIGVAHKQGVDLRPILNLGTGPMNRTLTFLGWNVDSLGQLDGYRIGYQAFSPDVD